MNQCWPMFDLRLKTPDLLLRPMSESDLDAVVRSLPADVDLDPSATRFSLGDAALERGAVVMQHYWRSLGTWTPTGWRLNFVAYSGDTLIGVQELEGNEYASFRTVDSSSHINDGFRGRGFGKQMRLAVLALAYDHLGAKAAVSSAFHDNHASLAVSRSLGYEPNGVSLEKRGDGVDVLHHMRMTRDQWLRSGGSRRVEVTGVEELLPYFGISE